MDVFHVVKDNVTARQVAEYYGMKIGRNGMACCPFHDDKHPSMKLDKRYYCFGCGEKGDAIDFVGKYFGMTSKDAAMKIADDFGLSDLISYDILRTWETREPGGLPSFSEGLGQDKKYMYIAMYAIQEMLREQK